MKKPEPIKLRSIIEVQNHNDNHNRFEFEFKWNGLYFVLLDVVTTFVMIFAAIKAFNEGKILMGIIFTILLSLIFIRRASKNV